jgi:hypothetical protein
MKSGQWATFEGSTRSKTAYQLYRTLLSKLSSELRPEYIDQWPVMFRGEQGSLTANESKMRYQEFLKNLKQVCRLLGYDEDMLGTHSLLRGSVTDQFQCGIPGQVIKTSGRWKSADFQHYIDQETILSPRASILSGIRTSENQITSGAHLYTPVPAVIRRVRGWVYAQDPPFWKVPNKSLSLSLVLDGYSGLTALPAGLGTLTGRGCNWTGALG